MRFLRFTLLFFCLLLVIFLASLMFIGSSTERTVGAAKALVAWATPYQLELRDPDLRWSPFRFKTALLLIKYPDPTAPPVISMQNLSLDVPLAQLFSGSPSAGTFAATNVSYFIDNQTSDEPINIEELLFPLELLPSKMEIDSVHFMSRNETVWIFPLADVLGVRREDGALDTSARAEVSGRPVLFEAIGRWRTLNDGHHRLELDASLANEAGDSMVEIQGGLNAVDEALDYNFDIDGSYEQVSDFVRAFDERAYAFAGNLGINGRLSGTLDGFTLAISKLRLTTPGDYEFTAQGSVTQSGNGPIALALTASGEATDLEGILPLPPAVLTRLERSELQLDVAGTLVAPTLSAARVVLFAAGNTQLSLELANTTLALDDLDSLELSEDEALQFRLSSDDLQALHDEALPSFVTSPLRLSAGGLVKGSMNDLRASLSQLNVANEAYTLSASGRFQWHLDTLSAPELSGVLTDTRNNGTINIDGTIADLSTLRGLGLQLDFKELSLEQVASDLSFDQPPVDLTPLNGQVLLLKAADPWMLRDLSLRTRVEGSLELQLNGTATLDTSPQADLQWQVSVADPEAWRRFTTQLPKLETYTGTLRLRPNYATALGTLQLGETEIQTVLSADIEKRELQELSLDLYSPHLHIPDLLPLRAASNNSPGATPASDRENNLQALQDALPAFPIHASLRSDVLTGPMSRLEQLSIAVEGNKQRLVLSHFDTRYAEGELMLRGLLDYSLSPPVASLAGQGIRVPLDALTQDFGVQQSVRGSLSVRGGVTSRGNNTAELLAALDGRVAAAANDMTVSGAAYDLLMSNLLAWLVKGVNEKTTTFNCVMAQFDVKSGIAKSDSLYVETRRMLATGKSSINLGTNTLDLRLEPRSKTRTVQFPSDVKVTGPLSAPAIKVSALQTTADLSAQALLLLPNLTLQLFGLTPDRGGMQPCVALLN